MTTCLSQLYELYFQAWMKIHGGYKKVNLGMRESYKALRAHGAPEPIPMGDLGLTLASDAVDTSCPARLGDSLMAALSAAEPGKLLPILQQRSAELIAFIGTRSDTGRSLFGPMAVACAASLDQKPLDATRLEDYVTVCIFGLAWLRSVCDDVTPTRQDIVDLVYRIALQHTGAVLPAFFFRFLGMNPCRETDARIVAAIRLALAAVGHCIVCRAPALACRGCRDARYCSLAHQRLDWPTHGPDCRKRTLATIFAEAPPLSRLVTAKDLEHCLHGQS